MIRMNENRNFSIGEVFDKCRTLGRRDFAAPSKGVRVIPNTEGEPDMLMLQEAPDSTEALMPFPMTDHARSQLHGRWNGLETFSRECERREWKDLYRETVNGCLSRDERQVQVRTIEPNGQRIARAVVSDAFKAVDDQDLIPVMADIVDGHKDTWRAFGGQVTDTKTYLRFITKEPQVKLSMGSGEHNLFIGWQYSNSEVGAGYLQCGIFFFDGYCENGCIYNKMIIADVKMAHRGARIQTAFGPILEERIREAELLNAQGMLADATRLALEAQYVPEVREMLEGAVSRTIPKGKEGLFLEEIGKRIGLTEEERNSALVHYDGKDRNQFGAHAAITRLAQDADDYAGRARLEGLGGKVLEMADNQWKAAEAMVT
jgi:hypothetical protein